MADETVDDTQSIVPPKEKKEEEEDDSWLYEPAFKKRASPPILIADEEAEVVAMRVITPSSRPPPNPLLSRFRSIATTSPTFARATSVITPRRVQTFIPPIHVASRAPPPPKPQLNISIVDDDDDDEVIRLPTHTSAIAAQQIQEAQHRRLQAPYWNEKPSGEVIMDVDFAVGKVGVDISQQTHTQTHPIVLHFWDNIRLALHEMPTAEALAAYYRVDPNFTQTATHEQWRVRDTLMRRRIRWLQVEFDARREPWRTTMKKDVTRRMQAHRKAQQQQQQPMAPNNDDETTDDSIATWLIVHGTSDECARWHALDGEIKNADKRKHFFMRRHLFGPLTAPVSWNVEEETLALDALQADLEMVQQQHQQQAEVLALQVDNPKKRKRQSGNNVTGVIAEWMQPFHPSLARWLCSDKAYWYQPAIDVKTEKANEAAIEGNTSKRIEQMHRGLRVYAQFWSQYLGLPRIDVVRIECQKIKFGAEGPMYEAAMNMFFKTIWPDVRLYTTNAVHKLKALPLSPNHIQTLISNDIWNQTYWYSITPGNALVVRRIFAATSKRLKQARVDIDAFLEENFSAKRWLVNRDEAKQKKKKKNADEEGEDVIQIATPANSPNKSETSSSPSTAATTKKSNFFATRHLNGRARHAIQHQREKAAAASPSNATEESPTKKRKKKRRQGGEGEDDGAAIAYGHTATAEEQAARIANKKEAVARTRCLVEERFDWDVLGVAWKSRFDWVWDNEDRRDAADAILQMISQRIPEEEKAKNKKKKAALDDD